VGADAAPGALTVLISSTNQRVAKHKKGRQKGALATVVAVISNLRELVVIWWRAKDAGKRECVHEI